jgi:hypothetical protein
MNSDPNRGQDLAVIALVLGIVALPLVCWYPLSIAAAAAAIVCGYLAGRRGGSGGIARVGMLCGSVALLLCAVIIILPG